MASLRILNSKGDTAVTWAPEKLAAGDREARAAVQEAERIFRDARARGGVAFTLDAAKVATRIDRFDPLTDAEIVIVPRIAGGV